MIKILIVDDSETEISLLKSILATEKDFEIVGYAKNGKEAVSLSALLKPDIITMDINMPIMNGFEATHAIMSQHPVPIVIISSQLNDESLNTAFLALEAGAISVLGKPINVLSSEFKNEKRKIIDTLRSMSEIKVIKRRFFTKAKKSVVSSHNHDHINHVSTSNHSSNQFSTVDQSSNHSSNNQFSTANQSSTSISFTNNIELIAIGASVGGPQALKCILEKLNPDFPVPIVVVQHMTKGFISGFVKWLNENISLNTVLSENNDVIKKGNIYFAPDDYHMQVARSNDQLIIKLVEGKPISGFCPSVTALFHSVAKTCGKNSVGMLLTGMGSDGAKGLLDLKHAHAHTIIQNKESAIVFGMAGVAQSLGAVDKVLDLNHIADYLIKITE